MDENNELCRLIVDNTHDGIWVVDEDGQISFVNNRIAEMLGYEKEELLNRPVFDFMDEDVKREAQEILATSKSKQYHHHQFRLTKKNGEKFWVEFESTPLHKNGVYKGTLALIADITEQKINDTRLFAHEKQLDLIYNSAIDSMWLIGVEPGGNYRFESINASFKIVTGFKDEDAVGKLIEQVLPPISHDLVRSKYDEAVKTGRVVDYLEIAPLPAGKRVGEIRVIPVKNKEGKVTKLVCIANDVTAKAAAEEKNKIYEMQLSKAIIQAQEQERLQIGLELHDNVNQILAGSLLSLGIANELTPDRTAELIDKAKGYISNAIKEIRSLSHQLSPVAFDNASFNAVVEELIASINIQGKYTVRLGFDNFDFENESELKLNLYRILQEQLHNINKYAEANILEVNFSQLEDKVRLRIFDNGKGFDPLVEKKGIGINNINMRTKSFGGKFLLHSAPGKGCEMIIEIPLSKEHA